MDFKSKKLLNNSFLFTLGSIGSKFMVFFLIPIQTAYLTTNDYGIVDIILTTTALLIPFFSLSIYDALFRMVIDNPNQNAKKYFSNSMVFIFASIVLMTILVPLANVWIENLILSLFILLVFSSQLIITTLLEFIKALQFIKAYSIVGILNALLLLILNILFFSFFDFGLYTILISIIISNISISVFIVLKFKLNNYFDIKLLNYNHIKVLLLFSVPLMPNAIMWWVVNISDRYLILFFVGAGANGLFAVASKIPTIISVFSSVFMQAWQITSIEEEKYKDESNYTSQVFFKFSSFLFIVTSIVMIFNKSIISVLASPEFYYSWMIVPFLLIGALFASFSAFLGTIYITKKRTKEVFSTSLVAAVINVFLNIILIPLIGVIGAAISTLISFLSLWAIRVKAVNKMIKIKYNWKHLYINIFLLLNQAIISVWATNDYLLSIIFIIIIYLNRKIIKDLYHMISMILNR